MAKHKTSSEQHETAEVAHETVAPVHETVEPQAPIVETADESVPTPPRRMTETLLLMSFITGSANIVARTRKWAAGPQRALAEEQLALLPRLARSEEFHFAKLSDAEQLEIVRHVLNATTVPEDQQEQFLAQVFKTAREFAELVKIMQAYSTR